MVGDAWARVRVLPHPRFAEAAFNTDGGPLGAGDEGTVPYGDARRAEVAGYVQILEVIDGGTVMVEVISTRGLEGIAIAGQSVVVGSRVAVSVAEAARLERKGLVRPVPPGGKPRKG